MLNNDHRAWHKAILKINYNDFIIIVVVLSMFLFQITSSLLSPLPCPSPCRFRHLCLRFSVNMEIRLFHFSLLKKATKCFDFSHLDGPKWRYTSTYTIYANLVFLNEESISLLGKKILETCRHIFGCFDDWLILWVVMWDQHYRKLSHIPLNVQIFLQTFTWIRKL